HEGADVVLGKPERTQLRVDTGERRLEVAVDVVGERLEGRDIHHVNLVGEAGRLYPGPHQLVDHREKGGERLARAGRGRDQDVPPGRDGRPRRGLRRGCGIEGAGEPAGDGRMESGGHAGIEAYRAAREEVGERQLNATYSS